MGLRLIAYGAPKVTFPGDVGYVREDFEKWSPAHDCVYTHAMNAMFAACLVVLCWAASGCLLAAGGAGAEAGYIAAQDHRDAGQTMGDQWITTKVKTELIATKDVDARHIDVDTFKGVVTLYGHVASSGAQVKAVQVARGVKGVKAVVSKLAIRTEH